MWSFLGFVAVSLVETCILKVHCFHVGISFPSFLYHILSSYHGDEMPHSLMLSFAPTFLNLGLFMAWTSFDPGLHFGCENSISFGLLEHLFQVLRQTYIVCMQHQWILLHSSSSQALPSPRTRASIPAASQTASSRCLSYTLISIHRHRNQVDQRLPQSFISWHFRLACWYVFSSDF